MKSLTKNPGFSVTSFTCIADILVRMGGDYEVPSKDDSSNSSSSVYLEV